jgi:hypothetical protein
MEAVHAAVEAAGVEFIPENGGDATEGAAGMKDLVLAAYRYGHNHSYSYGYGYSHGGGWSDWIAHTVLSSIIHAMIYRVVFQLMHRLTLGEAVVLVVVVIAVLVAWGRSQDRRGW